MKNLRWLENRLKIIKISLWIFPILISVAVWAADQPNAKANLKSEDAECDARQIRLFHKLLNFKKLGIVFRNDIVGKSNIEKAAEELGIEIVSCYIKPEQIASDKITECLQTLVKSSEAICVTRTMLTNRGNISEIVRIANENSIPTFLQEGSEDVRYGFLMGLSDNCGKLSGKTPKIAINIRTAKIIRYDPPLEVLEMADKIYPDIEK